MTANDVSDLHAGLSSIKVTSDDSKLHLITTFINNVLSATQLTDVDDYLTITQLFYNCIVFSNSLMPCYIKWAVSGPPVFLSEPAYIEHADNGLIIYYWRDLISKYLEEGDEDLQITLDLAIIETKCARPSMQFRPKPYMDELKSLKLFAIAYHLFCHYLDGVESDYIHHTNFTEYLPFSLSVSTNLAQFKIASDGPLGQLHLSNFLNTKDLAEFTSISRYGLANSGTI